MRDRLAAESVEEREMRLQQMSSSAFPELCKITCIRLTF